jgi:hypothetical protein
MQQPTPQRTCGLDGLPQQPQAKQKTTQLATCVHHASLLPSSYQPGSFSIHWQRCVTMHQAQHLHQLLASSCHHAQQIKWCDMVCCCKRASFDACADAARNRAKAACTHNAFVCGLLQLSCAADLVLLHNMLQQPARTLLCRLGYSQDSCWISAEVRAKDVLPWHDNGVVCLDQQIACWQRVKVYEA